MQIPVVIPPRLFLFTCTKSWRRIYSRRLRNESNTLYCCTVIKSHLLNYRAACSVTLDLEHIAITATLCTGMLATGSPTRIHHQALAHEDFSSQIPTRSVLQLSISGSQHQHSYQLALNSIFAATVVPQIVRSSCELLRLEIDWQKRGACLLFVCYKVSARFDKTTGNFFQPRPGVHSRSNILPSRFLPTTTSFFLSIPLHTVLAF